jgi:hypothetical protein
MTPKIEQQLDALDKSLNALLSQLLPESHDILDKKLSPERWSVFEVMQHLMLAEANSLRYLRKKSLGVKEMQAAGFRAGLRIWLLELSLKSPFKFKAPKGTDTEVFEPVGSFADLSGRWQQQRGELRLFLAGLPPEIFNKEAYRHPRGGMLSISGMLRFFQIHFDRHSLQMDRTMRELRPRL